MGAALLCWWFVVFGCGPLQQRQAKARPCVVVVVRTLAALLSRSSHQSTSTAPCPHQRHPPSRPAHYFLLLCLLQPDTSIRPLFCSRLSHDCKPLSLSLTLAGHLHNKQRTYPSSRPLAHSFLTTPDRSARPAIYLASSSTAPAHLSPTYTSHTLTAIMCGIFGYINYLVEKDRKFILDTLVNGTWPAACKRWLSRISPS
jgi:hypothetical protein